MDSAYIVGIVLASLTLFVFPILLWWLVNRVSAKRVRYLGENEPRDVGEAGRVGSHIGPGNGGL